MTPEVDKKWRSRDGMYVSLKQRINMSPKNTQTKFLLLSSQYFTLLVTHKTSIIFCEYSHPSSGKINENLEIFLFIYYRGPAIPTFDRNTVYVFGGNSKNSQNCALIKINSKHEETVVAEVDYRRGCAFGCVSGKNVFLKLSDCKRDG